MGKEEKADSQEEVKPFAKWIHRIIHHYNKMKAENKEKNEGIVEENVKENEGIVEENVEENEGIVEENVEEKEGTVEEKVENEGIVEENMEENEGIEEENHVFICHYYVYIYVYSNYCRYVYQLTDNWYEAYTDRLTQHTLHFLHK